MTTVRRALLGWTKESPFSPAPILFTYLVANQMLQGNHTTRAGSQQTSHVLVLFQHLTFLGNGEVPLSLQLGRGIPPGVQDGMHVAKDTAHMDIV